MSRKGLMSLVMSVLTRNLEILQIWRRLRTRGDLVLRPGDSRSPPCPCSRSMPPRADAFEPDIDSLLAKLATTPATLPPPLSDHAEQAAKRSRSGGLFALSFLLNSSALVLLVALAVGLVSSLKPTLFLTIPHVGFVPWMLSGHPLPPDQDGTPLQAQYFHTYVVDDELPQ